jgi:hypothetical protein
MDKKNLNWRWFFIEFSAICIIWLIFLHKIIGGKYSFATHIDNESFLAPVLAYTSEVLRHGEWPLWMNTVLGGIPLFNFAQLSPFYPFYFSALPIFGTPLEAMRSMHLITLMHLFIFLGNSYIFLRTLGISRVAAIAGGAFIAFNQNSQNYAVWINITAPYSWLPLYLAGLIKTLHTPTSLSSTMTMMFAMVMLTLASPAQPLIHAVVITAILCSFYAVFLYGKGEIKKLPSAFFAVTVVACLSILLTAPVLVPVVNDFKDMIRWVGPFPPVIGNDKIPFEAFLTDQVQFADIPSIFFKMNSNQAVGGLFIGLIPIALATKAYSARNSHWVVWPMIFILFYSLLSAFGSNFGFAQINYHIPLINKIREPSRFLFLFQFSIGILAAIGIDRIATEFSEKHQTPIAHRKRFFGILVVLAIAFSIVVAFKIQGRGHEVALRTLLPLTILVLGSIFAIRLFPTSSRKFLLFFWAILLIGMQWIQVPWTAPKISESQYLSGDAIGLTATLEKISRMDPEHHFRVVFEDGVDKQQASMLASYLGIRTFNAYFNPAPYRQFQEIYYHGPRGDNYIGILGGKFLVCKDCTKKGTEGYKHIEDIAGFSIYEAPVALPYTYVAHTVNGTFQDIGGFVAAVANMDLQRPLLLTEPDAWHPSENKQKTGESTCIYQAIQPKQFNIKQFTIQCAADGVLVLNEFFNTAWQLRIDGETRIPLKVNGNQIGAPFSAGAHVIEFRYSPPVFQKGMWAFFAGLLSLGGFIYTMRRIVRHRSFS